MKRILLLVMLLFVFFSISEGKSWESLFYDLIKSTDVSIRIVDEQDRTLTMDEVGVIISSNVPITISLPISLFNSLMNVWVTSGTVWNKNYKGENSTGTILAVGAAASVSHVLQSTVVGIYIDAEEDNTDNVRYRLGIDENVNTVGNKLHSGDFVYIGDFKGTIYFQSESGDQSIIINEVDE